MSNKEEDEDYATEVRPEETEFPAEPVRDDTEEEFHPFEEMVEEFKPSAIPKVIAADGLPTQATMSGSHIPPLSTETLVCMEDLSSFVRRDSYGNILRKFSPEEVERVPSGVYLTKVGVLEGGQMSVQPIRPRCQHYVRQLGMFEHNPEGKVHLRLCSARRTTEGTFMTLRDSAMWACSMRNPRDLASEALMDNFDLEKVEQGKHREHFSIFSSETK